MAIYPTNQDVLAQIAAMKKQVARLLILSQETGAGVESVVAGSNITIDETDPANPIVSAAAYPVAGPPRRIYIDPESNVFLFNPNLDLIFLCTTAGRTLSIPYTGPGAGTYLSIYTFRNGSSGTLTVEVSFGGGYIDGTPTPFVIAAGGSLKVVNDGTDGYHYVSIL